VGVSNDHGNTTLLIYDGLNRRLGITYHLRAGGAGSGAVLGQVSTSLIHDGNGRLVRQLDPNGNPTAYGYDALDRLTSTTYADGTTASQAYDRASNPVRCSDANGNIVTLTYDALNRHTRTDIQRAARQGGTALQALAWDGLSRLVSASDNNDPSTPADDSSMSLTYDSLSNPRSEAQDGRTARSTYDGVGNRLSLVYPSGISLTFTYDALDRIKTVAEGATTLGAFAYMGPLRLIRRTDGNGTYTAYVRDGAGQIQAVEHRRSSDNALLSGFSYGYDRNGNRLTEVSQPGGRPSPTPMTASIA
jgi:YD repeat-containing protein